MQVSPLFFSQVLEALPQTQCRRCGYPDCAAYAQAIAEGSAKINQCPPGGAQGIERLAAITGQEPMPLNPEYGIEAPRKIVFIDEAWCIGCTLCMEACPTDAIVGSNKRMHTIIEPYCTGCELCLPVCPVDCILTENVSGTATGWDAWSAAHAQQAKHRYTVHQTRTLKEKHVHADQKIQELEHKHAHLEEHSKITDAALLDKKRAMIEAALARAKLRNAEKSKL